MNSTESEEAKIGLASINSHFSSSLDVNCISKAYNDEDNGKIYLHLPSCGSLLPRPGLPSQVRRNDFCFWRVLPTRLATGAPTLVHLILYFVLHRHLIKIWSNLNFLGMFSSFFPHAAPSARTTAVAAV